MKVLQINSHYDQGGAARIVATLHRQLLKSGIESYVAYGRGEIAQEEKVYRFGNNLGAYTSALCSRISGWNGCFNRRATKKLIKLIRQIQPDIIHMHVLHGYYINVPMLFHYINKNNIPCVWTFHDCHAFTGNCGYFFDCRKWEKGCSACPYLKNYPVSQWFDHTGEMWLQKKMLFTKNTNKMLVTPSMWLREETTKSFFEDFECVTIANGIDTEQTFYPRDKETCRKKYGYTSNEKLILGVAVGYRDERKGAEYILQLAKDLENEAKVILIGWNHEKNHLLKDLNNVVTLKNTKDKELLAEHYSMADVFVIPSLAENYATTSLEAMACGTPVVGFDVGGIGEQVVEGKGRVVSVGNREAFAEAVREVLNHSEEFHQGERLARTIRLENSAEKMAEQYEELYICLYEKNKISEVKG